MTRSVKVLSVALVAVSEIFAAFVLLSAGVETSGSPVIVECTQLLQAYNSNYDLSCKLARGHLLIPSFEDYQCIGVQTYPRITVE